MRPSDEDKLRALYREHLDEELSRPEIIEDKEKLIQDHFKGTPSWTWPISVMVPALSVLLLVFIVTELMPIRKPILKETQQPTLGQMDVYRERTMVKKVDEFVGKDHTSDDVPKVAVKRAVSEVGTVMVYQKIFQKEPVTIVWVFPGG